MLGPTIEKKKNQEYLISPSSEFQKVVSGKGKQLSSENSTLTSLNPLFLIMYVSDVKTLKW
jgi:hypothetical protein